MKILLLFVLALMVQSEVAFKPNDEFSLELNYAFKQRPASDISTFEYEGNQEERDKAKYGGGPLPYLIVQIKLLKLNPQEVRMRCTNNKGEVLVTRKAEDPLNTLKTRMFHARKKLAQLLAQRGHAVPAAT